MNDQNRWTLTDAGAPPHFLPRLDRGTFGALPRGPFASRVFLRAQRKPVMVASTRPDRGVSLNLLADEQGNWLAYVHHHRTGRRQRTGSSRWWTWFAEQWRVHP